MKILKDYYIFKCKIKNRKMSSFLLNVPFESTSTAAEEKQKSLKSISKIYFLIEKLGNIDVK